MAFTPLTKEQYQKALDSGFNADQIIQFEKQRKQAETSPSEKKLNFLQSIYKGAASPVVNMLSRPGELFTHLTGIGGGKEENLGADVPIGFGVKATVTDPYAQAQQGQKPTDIIKKEAGLGLQTAALGLGPVSGGAAYAGGSALEQGKSVPMSAAYAAAGAVGGKVFDLALRGFGGLLTKAGKTTLRDVATSIEKSSLPLTNIQKAKMASQLTRASEYLLDHGIKGSNETRIATVKEFMNVMEKKLQNFLETNNTAKGISVSKSWIISQMENLKNELMRDSSNAPIIEKQIDSAINNIKAQYRYEKIPISRLNALKRSTYKDAYTKAGDKVLDWVEHDLGDIYKTAIEDATKGLTLEGKPIGDFNKEYGDLITTKKLLTLVQGKNVSTKIGGKLVTSMLGALTGYELGGKQGAVEGAVGGYAGAALLPKLIETLMGAESRSAVAAALNKFSGAMEKSGVSGVAAPFKTVLKGAGKIIGGTPEFLKTAPRTDIPGTIADVFSSVVSKTGQQGGQTSVGAMLGGGAAATAALGAGAMMKSENTQQPETQSTMSSDQKQPVNTQALIDAIAKNETGGVVLQNPYKFHKPSGSKAMGEDLGKYQITEAELRENAKKFIGRSVTKAEFLADPKLQDDYMKGKIKFLTDAGVSVDGIIALHSQGMTGYGDPKVIERKIQESNQRRKNYVKRALENYHASTTNQ